MQTLRWLIVLAITLAFHADGVPAAVEAEPVGEPVAAQDEVASDEPKTDGLRWLDTELFSVQIPNSWSEVKEEQLEALREPTEKIVREIVPPEISPDSPVDRILWLNAFDSADGGSRLLIMISTIPPPEGSGRTYVEGKVLGYADLKRAQEVVKEVKVGEEKELNGMPAVELVVELEDGVTLYALHVWTTVYRDRVGTVLAINDPGLLAPTREAIQRILKSVKPSELVAKGLAQDSFRQWLRDTFWLLEGASPTRVVLQRATIVLIVFTVCFVVSLRLVYESILAWYRLWKIEDRVAEMARRAARDALRIGYSYSQRMIMACAALSLTVTALALVWVSRP